MSVVERTIVKELMTKCALEQPELSLEATLSQAIRTWNQREPVRGYSPYQWMFGKAPDFSDRMFTPELQKIPGSLLHHPDNAMHRSEELRRLSEKAFVDWQYAEKLSRARNSKARNYNWYMPGDLVFFWRLQGKGRQSNSSGIKKGAYAGPARILAMETREKEGKIQPGSAVWLVRGMRLIKVAVEQLRPASEKEILQHELSSPPTSGPWTMTRLVEQLGPHDYDDLSTHRPDPEDIMDPLEGADMDCEERPRGVPPGLREEVPRDLIQGASWQGLVPESFWAETANPAWEDEAYAVELQLELPVSGNQMNQFVRNPEQFFIKSLKRKNVEVSERRLQPEEREGFRNAKTAEVKKFLSAKAMEALPPDMIPDRNQALKMRWILTYKVAEGGTTKPKARAVILGYQDPDYANRPTFAPTMTRNSRQLLLQLAAWRGMTTWKGDVSGAFLQGREYGRDLQVEPVPELCDGLGLPRGTLCKLRKACYGLVEAPIEWFETVNSFLCSLGYRQMKSDPCTWILEQGGNTISIISGHVDDFLFLGDRNCKIWNNARAQIQERFQWQEWEEDSYVQCGGVKVSRNKDGSYDLSQEHYVEGIPEIVVGRERRRDRHSPTSDAEKSQLRACWGP